MIPGISAGGPISAFTGSGGFDGGTATSGAKGSASSGGATFYVAPPVTAQPGVNWQLFAIGGLLLVSAWALLRR